VRRRMCMDIKLNVVLTKEDIDELARMIQDTLARLVQIASRHSEVMNTGDINLFRSFIDEMLINYTSALLKTHLKLLQDTVNEYVKIMSGEGKESGIL
jgi:hypothetical protein